MHLLSHVYVASMISLYHLHNYLYSTECAFPVNTDSFTDLPQENEGQKEQLLNGKKE